VPWACARRWLATGAGVRLGQIAGAACAHSSQRSEDSRAPRGRENVAWAAAGCWCRGSGLARPSEHRADRPTVVREALLSGMVGKSPWSGGVRVAVESARGWGHRWDLLEEDLVVHTENSADGACSLAGSPATRTPPLQGLSRASPVTLGCMPWEPGDIAHPWDDPMQHPTDSYTPYSSPVPGLNPQDFERFGGPDAHWLYAEERFWRNVVDRDMMERAAAPHYRGSPAAFEEAISRPSLLLQNPLSQPTVQDALREVTEAQREAYARFKRLESDSVSYRLRDSGASHTWTAGVSRDSLAVDYLWGCVRDQLRKHFVIGLDVAVSGESRIYDALVDKSVERSELERLIADANRAEVREQYLGSRNRSNDFPSIARCHVLRANYFRTDFMSRPGVEPNRRLGLLFRQVNLDRKIDNFFANPPRR
jgi:hypothetical protein